MAGSVVHLASCCSGALSRTAFLHRAAPQHSPQLNTLLTSQTLKILQCTETGLQLGLDSKLSDAWVGTSMAMVFWAHTLSLVSDSTAHMLPQPASYSRLKTRELITAAFMSVFAYPLPHGRV